MSITAKLIVDNKALHLDFSNGTTQTFADWVEGICKTNLPTDLRGQLGRNTTSRDGNFLFSFEDGYFPTKKRNESDADYSNRRATAIAQRFAILGLVCSELMKLGLRPGPDFSPRDTYRHTDGTYRSTTQIWLNPNEVGSGNTRSKTPEELAAEQAKANEELLMQCLGVDEEKTMAIMGDDVENFTTMKRARLRIMLKATSTPVKTKAAETETEDEIPD